MTREELINQIRKKSSILCIGLDTDITKLPRHLLKLKDPVFEFNKAIIDATADFSIAYKPNLAFYERSGPEGLESLKKTIDYIPKDFFKIGDAKRGDIGNTSQMYADAFFGYYGFDAITLSPYMGKDSIDPYLSYKDKWAVLLALTSNQGSADFQMSRLESGERLYEKVIRSSAEWAGADQLMYVVGATKTEYISGIRKLIPDHFLLVPGIGAQGGDLENVVRNGYNRDVGLIINVSRSVLFASGERDFHIAAKKESGILREKMKILLENLM
jgi:orotidine-5'-phosphate decarboxylase